MNKILISLLLFFSLYSTSYSQIDGYTDRIIDSLKNVVEVSTTDSVTLKAIKKLYQHYGNNDPEQHYFYIKKGLIITERTNDVLNKAKLLSQLAHYHKTNNNIDTSIFYFNKAEDLYLKLNDSSSYYKLEYTIANILINKAKYEEAIAIFNKGISYHKNLNNEKGQLGALRGRINLSGLYFSMRDYEKSIEICKQVERSEIAKKRPKYIRSVWINLTGLYITVNQLDSALIYAKKAEKVVIKKNELINLNTNIGGIYEMKKQYDKALIYFYKSLRLSDTLNNNYGITMSSNNIAQVYLEKGELDSAELYLLKSKELLESEGKISSIEHNYRELSNLYLKKKNYKKALEYKELQVKYKDSLLGIEKQEAIIDVEKKYETQKIKQEKKIAEGNTIIADERASNSRKFSIGAFIFAGVIFLLLVLLFNRLKLIRIKNKQLDEAYLLLEESKKYELAASNLKALKSQMNPHFIFNSLNSIQDLIIKNEKETSYDYIVLFAELVRSSLNNSNNDFIPIEEEMEFLEVYLKLEKLRFGNDFNYEIITNEIDDIYIPLLIIQPFLENALLHGLMHKKGNKKLTIEFDLDKELLCTITDNGVGREEAKRIKNRRGTGHESFAMNAIEERLSLLSERFDYSYKFEVEDLYEYDIPCGTRIKLSIPFEEEYYQD